MKKRIYTILLLLILLPLTAQLQPLSTKKKKAIQYYNDAEMFRVRGQYNQAATLFNQAIDKDDGFVEAYFKLGKTWDMAGNRGKAIGNYYRAFQLLDEKTKIPELNYELAKVFLLRGELDKSEYHAVIYLSGETEINKEVEIEKIKIDIEFTRKNPPGNTSVRPEAMPVINRFPMQYFPMITADNLALLFTKRGPQIDEDIYISLRDNENDEWTTPFSIANNINTEANEGTCTMSTDKRLLIFTSCQARGGHGSCDLYFSERVGSEWTYPENLGPVVNSPFWDSQPTLSANGDVLYFISERPGGVGAKDIWMSKKLYEQENKWSKPVNLGAGINTPLDEVAPFIHANGVELYFSSNGYPGYGGFDIYKSELNIKSNEWSAPKNIGYPVNTAEDQVGFFISPKGDKAYYSIENQGGYGLNSRIVNIDLPESARTNYNISYVFGKVTDAGSDEPLASDVGLFDLEQNEKVAEVTSDSILGDYKIVLKQGSLYSLYFNKAGYLFESLTFEYDSTQMQPVRKDIQLRKLMKGNKTVLRNIFFETGSYRLQDHSITELSRVRGFLSKYPELNIVINGHTDDVGTEEDNKELSKQRARAVYSYLIENGIEKERVLFRGFGEEKPLVPNNSPENRKLNRRIEFEIN